MLQLSVAACNCSKYKLRQYGSYESIGPFSLYSFRSVPILHSSSTAVFANSDDSVCFRTSLRAHMYPASKTVIAWKKDRQRQTQRVFAGNAERDRERERYIYIYTYVYIYCIRRFIKRSERQRRTEVLGVSRYSSNYPKDTLVGH